MTKTINTETNLTNDVKPKHVGGVDHGLRFIRPKQIDRDDTRNMDTLERQSDDPGEKGLRSRASGRKQKIKTGNYAREWAV